MTEPPCLLAVDLGLRTGLALFEHDGSVRWFRSHHVSKASALDRVAHSVLRDEPRIRHVVAEGDRRLFELWEREAVKRGATAERIGAETWRALLLHEREQRSTKLAKQAAGELARAYLEANASARPTALRHDTAEAVLIGVWACVERGWVRSLPETMMRGRALRPAPSPRQDRQHRE